MDMDAISREKACEIANAWGLNDQQRKQLLNQPDATSQVVTIDDALYRIFEMNQVRANAWVKKPNAAFDKRSALDLMLSGDIDRVREYVMYQLYNGY
jgi:cyanate lyase